MVGAEGVDAWWLAGRWLGGTSSNSDSVFSTATTAFRGRGKGTLLFHNAHVIVHAW